MALPLPTTRWRVVGGVTLALVLTTAGIEMLSLHDLPDRTEPAALAADVLAAMVASAILICVPGIPLWRALSRRHCKWWQASLAAVFVYGVMFIVAAMVGNWLDDRLSLDRGLWATVRANIAGDALMITTMTSLAAIVSGMVWQIIYPRSLLLKATSETFN